MPESLAAEVKAVLDRALAFLAQAQLPSGEFPVLTSLLPDMADEGTPDPAIFPTALAVHCLSFTDGTVAMRQKAAAFLLEQRDGHGLWRHWARDHAFFHTLPADLDDTCCVLSALGATAAGAAEIRNVLLANRDARGRFYTWFTPRLRWSGLAHAKASWSALRHPLVLWMFFRQTSAAPSDVDAGVNANALHYLGAFPGCERVTDWLLEIVREGREGDADKWYDNRFVLWYLIARALVPLTPEATPLLLARLNTATPTSALERALALSIEHICDAPLPEEWLKTLLAEQSADGSWPRAAVYFGGRERRRDNTLAPAHPDTPRWGSEALTTAFAVEALARWLKP